MIKVRILIWPIFQWRWWRCEPVEEHFFPKVGVGSDKLSSVTVLLFFRYRCRSYTYSEVHLFDCRLWCIPVGPCFVDSYETTQKLLRIALKQCQILFMVALVFRSENKVASSAIFYTWYDRRDLLRSLLSQLSSTLSRGGLPIQDHELLSCYPPW